jgi:hypothetical protein
MEYIRMEYMRLLYNPPKKLMENKILLKNLRGKSAIITEEDIYNNILLIYANYT